MYRFTHLLAALLAIPAAWSCPLPANAAEGAPVPQRIVETTMEGRDTLVVRFRRYLDAANEATEAWSFTPAVTVLSVVMVPRTGGRRSATYRVRLAAPLVPGTAYRLAVGDVAPYDLVAEARLFFTFPGGARNAVVLSFDDGPPQDRKLVELFNLYKLKGTFNLNSARFGHQGQLRAAEVRALFAGHEIAGHTLSHPHLEAVPRARVAVEVGDDLAALSKLAGAPVRGFAYPFGTWNAMVREELVKAGVLHARTVSDTGDTAWRPHDVMTWRPTCHHSRALAFAKEFATPGDGYGRLLFVWGHAWELDRNQANNGWVYMEDLCKAIAAASSTWSATAGEVAAYEKACAAVTWTTAGGLAATNPSRDTAVWLRRADGSALRLGPGATARP